LKSPLSNKEDDDSQASIHCKGKNKQTNNDDGQDKDQFQAIVLYNGLFHPVGTT
jgi:hypothetical protein